MFEMNPKEQQPKTSDQEIGEFIGYGIGLFLLALLVIFFAPALVVGLLAVIGYKQMRKKAVNLICAVSLIGFGASLYFWGYLPMFQFASWWKKIDKLVPVIRKTEEFLQQGQVFKITLISYLMLTLAGLVLGRMLLAVFDRLGVNWLTKEKEENKQKYLASDKFKRYFEKRLKLGKKHQNKYRKSDTKEVYLGLNERQKEVSFPITSLFTHALVQGTTGAGKTTLMYAIMESALRNGFGSIFIDGKGDGTTEEEIRKLADSYGKEVFVFSESTDYRYNPVKYGSATAIKDRLMDSMTWSDKFYENEAQNQLQQILLFVEAYIQIEQERGHRVTQGEPLRKDLATIHRFLSLKEIANYLFIEQSEYVITKDYKPKQGFDEEDSEEKAIDKEKVPYVTTYQRYMRIFFGTEELSMEDIEAIEDNLKETNKYIRGLRTQLELLIYSDLGQKFIDDPEKTLDIKQILLDGNIVLYSFDTNSYSRFMESIGRFIVSDISSIVTQLYKERKINGFNGAIGFFDEFGSYVNEKILDILRKARSAHLGAVIGVQAISDFQTAQGDLTKQARNNMNLFFLGRSNDPDNAEDSANTAGTYRDIDKTVMTENIGGSLFRVDTKADRGTIRKVNKYWFSPDEVKDMPNYTFLYINKTTDQLEPPKEKVFIRNVLNGLQ